jgi:hypothetical protein
LAVWAAGVAWGQEGGPIMEGAPARTIVLDGRPAARIILQPAASAREEEAAQEMQRYVQKASGAVLPVVKTAERPAGNAILIEVQAPPPGASREAFTITTAGGSVKIVGNSPLAALYGAYELLERGLGVRWYLPGDLGEVVPQQKTIALPDLKVAKSPSFPMRWIGTGEWALRNKQNRCDDGFVISPGIYHTQGRLLPHKQYFKEHPEFFALVKGKRSEDGGCKLCTSNPAVAVEVARNMSRMLDEKLQISLISLSPTDGMLYCECEKCKAQDEPGAARDQRMSRRMLLFYNAVAAELRKTHPEAKMLVGAYHIYTWPPKDPAVKADPMISVIICHYEDYCLAHSVADPNCPPNARYRQLIQAWQDLGCKVYFYEYYWKVNWMDLPWPIVHSIKGDMAWYKAHDVQGVYTQYNADNVWTLFPGYYVAARLLWDVNADADAIMSRMCEDLFGKAAPAMKAYYALLEDRMATCGAHMPGRGLQFGPTVFTDEVRAAMRREYERALGLNDDPVVKKRLEKIGVSIEYMDRLMNYAKLAAEIKQQKSPESAASKAKEASEWIARLADEVLKDRAKWGGVVSRTLVRGEAYLGWEKEAAAKRAAAMSRGVARDDFEPIAPLPVKWRFALDPKDVGVKEKWLATEFDDSGWKEIEIGKTWESQGYDYNGFAWYRTRFEVKPEWIEKGPVALHFGAVDGDAWVYWNGQLVGEHKGWDDPFSLPLRPEMIQRDAPNLLAVRVWDGAGPGGIWRPAHLARLGARKR